MRVQLEHGGLVAAACHAVLERWHHVYALVQSDLGERHPCVPPTARGPPRCSARCGVAREAEQQLEGGRVQRLDLRLRPPLQAHAERALVAAASSSCGTSSLIGRVSGELCEVVGHAS